MLEEDYIFGTVCNTNYIGGFSMAGKVDTMLDDGQFEVLLIKAPQSVLELNALAGKLLARDFDNEFMTMTQASQVRFTFPKKDRLDFGWGIWWGYHRSGDRRASPGFADAGMIDK